MEQKDFEKQAIEEMAKVIANKTALSIIEATGVAEILTVDGYRKQKEGDWIDRYNGDFANPIYVCSVCGKGTLLKPYIDELGNMEMIQALSAFCPNCGSKMKGGAE